MSARILLGIILAVAAGEAQASSLVFPGTPSSTPSIVRIGAPNQPGTVDAVNTSDARSVMAVGEAPPDVTDEKVAAIPDKPATGHGFQPGPMVIRGGVTGPDFPAPAPTAAPATGAAPAAGTAPATATASAAPSGNAENNPAPPSAPAPAAGQRMPPNGYTK
ncbi:hypothetical protein [Mesorhizobium sp. M7A.F.Ca.CA.001.11.2.1]|uniref:hypothetical protein n=1 Tax=Mesorhizobium sp. M7A.F.Ca.CA.001.11.2.1 TaxID=2496693 RepID=UPI000FCC59C0|nr:hypothetical protein [Mesorhizobium sp. M7A.F.Ca.CA.001.11.2.1]RVA79515.1 hypothetical protein EN916_04305 [Mesorhizobium sp. M7A.F.Ca.CA.001.11.2.1]